jgi:hypothetical protein
VRGPPSPGVPFPGCSEPLARCPDLCTSCTLISPGSPFPVAIAMQIPRSVQSTTQIFVGTLHGYPYSDFSTYPGTNSTPGALVSLRACEWWEWNSSQARLGTTGAVRNDYTARVTGLFPVFSHDLANCIRNAERLANLPVPFHSSLDFTKHLWSPSFHSIQEIDMRFRASRNAWRI